LHLQIEFTNPINSDQTRKELKPFTVSAVYCDGLETMIEHCLAADAQAARDHVLMQTGGAVIIASVFAGHLNEPDAIVRYVGQDSSAEEEADSSIGERV
jgi:hypothetical protein